MNIKQAVQVFKALMDGPVCRTDLARIIDVQPKTVGRLLAEMKQQKLIYVIDYANRNDGRNRVRLYSLGEGEDAKPRDSIPQKERSRSSYLRKVAANSPFKPETRFVGGKSLWS